MNHMRVVLLSGFISPEFKGVLGKYNIIPRLLKKKTKQKQQKKREDFYTIRNAGMGNDCMSSFTF